MAVKEVDYDKLLADLKPVFRGEHLMWRVSIILARPRVKQVVSRTVEDESLEEVIQRIARYAQDEAPDCIVSVTEVIYKARIVYEPEPIVKMIQTLITSEP